MSREIKQDPLYELKLNEKCNVLYWEVTRVPGGWIYSANHQCCFVPFDNEFLKTSSEIDF